MSVCFTLVSLSALVNLVSVQPTRTVCGDATALQQMIHFHTDSLTEDYGIFWMDGLTVAAHIRRTLLFLHALFIDIRWFVTDSFSYPVAAIFHMAWFTMPLHAPLVDE